MTENQTPNLRNLIETIRNCLNIWLEQQNEQPPAYQPPLTHSIYLPDWSQIRCYNPRCQQVARHRCGNEQDGIADHCWTHIPSDCAASRPGSPETEDLGIQNLTLEDNSDSPENCHCCRRTAIHRCERPRGPQSHCGPHTPRTCPFFREGRPQNHPSQGNPRYYSERLERR